MTTGLRRHLAIEACPTHRVPRGDHDEVRMIETNTCADGRVRLRISGELSCTTAVSLRHVVDDSVGQGVTIVIDLRRVERIDAEGLSALVGTVRRARSVGGHAQVVNARPEVEATFQLAGVYDMLLSSTTTNDGA